MAGGDTAIRVLFATAVVTLPLVGCEPLPDPSLDPTPAATVRPTAGPASPEIGIQANPLRNLYWGDLHIHTSLSSDAFTMGVRALPQDVYRFAQGEPIAHGAGYAIAIRRPLDFAAVTDHAEYLGQARLADLDIPTTRQPLGELLRDGSRLAVTRAWAETMALIKENGFRLTLPGPDHEINRQAWMLTREAAEAHNQPGAFTTLLAWEWSADAGDVGTHLHRNVVYGDDRVPDRPFSALDGAKPGDLWRFLRAERASGRKVLAIPHNPNLSQGLMYQLAGEAGRYEGAPKDRSSLEPLSEILQVKGSSETHPLLSGLDEFADFEIADAVPGRAVTLETVTGSYARDALRRGISFSHREGFNPLQFGFIGASDSHNASSPTDEDSYTGKLPMMDGSAGLRTGRAGVGLSYLSPAPKWGSGGLAGVWATANTREAIFEALQSRETYATSGPRISLRMFGGWGLPPDLLDAVDGVAQADAGGVPMGSQLPPRGDANKPTFVVYAARDPLGANLDRLQIIKGWVDETGRSHERVFDIAWSGDRLPDASTGRLPPVGSTVDVAEADYRNTIGRPDLAGWWQDPEFRPDRPAFYYARVLEIPTPRWSTYDAKLLGIKPLQPATLQERAIGSAIWYDPREASSDSAVPAAITDRER